MTIKFARKLRKDQTEAERKIWYFLRDRRFEGLKFRRQHLMGPYIADFCCTEKKLIIELDGSQHFIQSTKDQERTAYLNSCGYQVLRFWDNEALTKPESVLESVRIAISENPHPNPLPERERESCRLDKNENQ